MRQFRFSSNIFGITSRQEFLDQCREAERYGYDAVFAPDHIGMPAPFPLLVAAAQATERMRVGTLVLNAPFWNPVLLAREIVTADILTDGRLDVGLGSGHMKWEFDEAGIPWPSFAQRAERLAETIAGLQRSFTAELPDLAERLSAPRPVQRQGFGGTGPPLLVGGTGNQVLRIAAEHADIVGVAGAHQLKGQPPGTFRMSRAAETDERMRYVRDCAGPRADRIEWHLLVQMVICTDDRRAAAEKLVADDLQQAEQRNLADRGDLLSVDEALQTPYLLIGTPNEIADQLRRSRERWGFSYITVHEPFMRTFAPVIERLRGE
jgi:probable F420-dependent oxidoreductase